jgi:hypothetical protein
MAHAQGEQHAAAVEDEAMEAGEQAGPLRRERLGQGHELGMAGRGPQEIVTPDRVGLDRDEVQQCRTSSVVAPSPPACQK